MNPDVKEWLQLVFRWFHVVAGIIWIGHLYFFNWVNGPFAKTMDGPTKKAVVPQLMPRALFWFRWGAAWTWISGVLLLGLVYYMGGPMYDLDNPGDPTIGYGIIIAGLILVMAYDAIQKAMKGTIVANALSVAVLAAVYFAMEYVGKFSFRALYIHVGALLGTTMAFNVWMRIWPAQKKIIAAVKEGSAPDAALVALAGLRSRQNTFMSVPLVFLMVSQHATKVAGPFQDAYLAAVIVVGWLATSWLYKKSAAVPGF